MHCVWHYQILLMPNGKLFESFQVNYGCLDITPLIWGAYSQNYQTRFVLSAWSDDKIIGKHANGNALTTGKQ